jgi:type II secretory pathway pseudopilin PulG
MSMKKRQGITLPEVMIYVVMAGMVAMAVSALFQLTRSAQQSTLSGYLVSGQADTALRWLRRDFQETALVSVRTYPSAAQPAQPPGCSLASARSGEDKNPELNISKYGTPFWSKHVFYTLQTSPGARRGDLIRWELPLTDAEKDFVPRPATVLPAALSSNVNRRVLLHDVLAPNTKVPNLGGKPNYQTDKYGGFRVQFVQRIGGESGAEQLSEVNPGDTKQTQVAENHTSLVQIRLEILADDKHNPSFYQLEFKAHPRY